MGIPFNDADYKEIKMWKDSEAFMTDDDEPESDQDDETEFCSEPIQKTQIEKEYEEIYFWNYPFDDGYWAKV